MIGSNAAARNARTEGAILGGLLGAIAGGVMGHKTAACNSSTYPSSSSTADDSSDRRDDYYRGRDGWTHSRDDTRDDDGLRAPDAAGDRRDDDCQLAESPVHMPDGTIQNRFVRVCRDASGRYAVVN